MNLVLRKSSFGTKNWREGAETFVVSYAKNKKFINK